MIILNTIVRSKRKSQLTSTSAATLLLAKFRAAALNFLIKCNIYKDSGLWAELQIRGEETVAVGSRAQGEVCS